MLNVAAVSETPSFTPAGNRRVFTMSLSAFSLGFGIWALFSALGPFLIEWYEYSAGQVMLLTAMEPLGAMLLSIPLGIVTDKLGGRIVFSALLLVLSMVLLAGMVVEGYVSFLILGMLLGLGGASFVVGNAHVSVWYPRSRQGTALGFLALGNFGIILGMVLAPLLVTHVLGGPAGYDPLPAKLRLGPIEGWRLIFPIFAAPTLVMAVLYWVLTSEPPGRTQRTSLREIASVYTSGKLVWIVSYLYWVSFGTLTFFASSMPTYLVDRWDVHPTTASMIFTSIIVACVAGMRPVGGWLSDHRDPLRMLTWFFAATFAMAIMMTLEVSLPVQIVVVLALALLSGAAAACVMKLIPTYFTQVGTVSGLAKAAGAACGFAMTSLMGLSMDLSGSYVPALGIWVGMNALALYVAYARVGFPASVPDDVSQPARHVAVATEPV